MNLASVSRYFHTARHLRPIQIGARLWNMMRPHRVDPRPALPFRALTGRWEAPVAGAAVMQARDTFRLLNLEGRCVSSADWQIAGNGRLWSYNLHYFDDLNAHSADERIAWHIPLIERWIAENPPGEGIGWEAYPVSRRIVNWIKWSLRGHELSAVARHSLAVQLRWLDNHLEFHILGNHLFANAKALVFGGLRFEGPEARRWLDRGLRLVDEQLVEQVLDDGGHFELSPMYHAAVLEDLLDLINAARAAGLRDLDRHVHLAGRMQEWLERMTHPDGEISFFNDAAFGVSPTASQLREYGARLGLGGRAMATETLSHLRSSGYVRASIGPADLICDCARVGPDYLPGHAHADTLSFELSFGGQRLLVNSGTSEYEPSAERDRQRGTAAHNAVVVEGKNSSEVWGSFRVARRASVRLHEVRAHSDGAEVRASHDGYRRHGAGEVSRHWSLGRDSLRIDDRIERECQAVARFHLHPHVTARKRDDASLIIECAGRTLRLGFQGAASVSLETDSWHPRFGERHATACISAQFSGNRLQTELNWRT